MARKIVLIAALAVLLMIEFTPGCHSVTLGEEAEEDVDLALGTEEEEDRALEENIDNENLWLLAERMAELVNERQKVEGASAVNELTSDRKGKGKGKGKGNGKGYGKGKGKGKGNGK